MAVEKRESEEAEKVVAIALENLRFSAYTALVSNNFHSLLSHEKGSGKVGVLLWKPYISYYRT